MFKVRLTNLPGFKSMNQYPFEQLFFDGKTATELYSDFKNALAGALNEKRFFPVMRMCDGEYIYCVGKKRSTGIRGIGILKFYAGLLLKKQSTSWGESYTREENKVLRKNFASLIKEISEQGIIANHFMYSHTHFAQEYIEPMRAWFQQNGIKLNSKNYTAFYFVYTLLNGPDSMAFFSSKNILVLSSFDAVKRDAVNNELKRRGAANVYFEPISKTQSMLDRLDLNKYKGKIDLVLVAAGIGSANILLQCKPLNTLCIDAGFSLECIADRTRREERIFCLPDAEY
jgi:hypothetical protein